MTRINCGIEPAELCDAHLLAEYRELPRIRTMAVKRYARYRSTGPRPVAFTLGKGHMKFFLPFGDYLLGRWCSLKYEMHLRGFATTMTWREYPEELRGTLPSSVEETARPLLIERIQSRLSEMKRKPRWSIGKPPEWALLHTKGTP